MLYTLKKCLVLQNNLQILVLVPGYPLLTLKFSSQVNIFKLFLEKIYIKNQLLLTFAVSVFLLNHEIIDFKSTFNLDNKNKCLFNHN